MQTDNSQTALISLELTEQQAILTLHFEHSSLKSMDKILQEGPQEFSLGTILRVSTSHYVTSPCM